MINNMKWNEKLKQARKNAKMTQQELADYLGVSRSTIANYEIQRRKPTFLELKKIAKRLNVDVNYLVEGDEVNKEIDLVTRASDVFTSVELSDEDKDLIFQDIMSLYMKGKGIGNESKRFREDKKL